jgi:uncharacterized iron-regulated membrane protein
MLRWSIRLHKWIALVVAIQVLGWVAGGLFMTAAPIQRVRSEHRIAHRSAPALDLVKTLPLAEVVKRAELGAVSEATLKSTPRGPIWSLVSDFGGEAWYDAVTGENVDEISEAQARAAAVADYDGPGKPVKLVRYDSAPAESGTTGTVWRVEFDDPERTSLYLSAYTGETLSRRSNLWRVYNFFYQIHIMNFTPGQNYNHPLIVGVTALTLAVVVTGVVLLWIRIGRDLKGLRARRASAR